MNTLILPTELGYCIQLNEGESTYCLAEVLINKNYNKLVLITDDVVHRIYDDWIKNLQQRTPQKLDVLTIPSGEKYKTRATKQHIEDQLIQLECHRDTCLIALGGGVVCDLVGFVAATYNRGVPVYYVPTTLLAMVDASIGGKTGVNTAKGKNLIGTFKQPKGVFIDTHFISTLSILDRIQGLAELVKHAILSDDELFHEIDTHWHDLVVNQYKSLQTLIARSCSIKSAIVYADLEETGCRVLLNLGHTVAHALEVKSHYTLPHGLAVLLGLYVELQCQSLTVLGLDSLLEKIGKYINSGFIDWQKWQKIYHDHEGIIEAISYDKKSSKGVPQFVQLPQLAFFANKNYTDFRLTTYAKEILSYGLNALLALLQKTPNRLSC